MSENLDAVQEGTVDGLEILKYAITETHRFFGALAQNIDSAINTGKLPANSARASIKIEGPAKMKRKPSAFNVYMQKKCEQMKLSGLFEKSDIFTQAASSWKNLTDDQRKGYLDLFHADPTDPRLDDLPEPLPGVINESRAEKRRAAAEAAPSNAETDITNFMSKLQKQKQDDKKGAKPVAGKSEVTSDAAAEAKKRRRRGKKGADDDYDEEE